MDTRVVTGELAVLFPLLFKNKVETLRARLVHYGLAVDHVLRVLLGPGPKSETSKAATKPQNLAGLVGAALVT